jgi:hypothetical protein
MIFINRWGERVFKHKTGATVIVRAYEGNNKLILEQH